MFLLGFISGALVAIVVLVLLAIYIGKNPPNFLPW